jgi:hypothetical protein
MVRISRRLVPMIAALAILTASVSVVQAQVVCYQPAPVVAAPAVSYYTPAPAVSYYAPAPAVSYYAPAPAVSYYAPAPAVSYYAPAPVVSYYAAPAPIYASYYVAPAAVTAYRYGPFGRLRGVRTYYGY